MSFTHEVPTEYTKKKKKVVEAKVTKIQKENQKNSKPISLIRLLC